jgi:hypothetical protein
VFIIVRPALKLILLLTELAIYLLSTVLKRSVYNSRSRTRRLTARYTPRTDLKLFIYSVFKTLSVLLRAAAVLCGPYYINAPKVIAGLITEV